MYIPDVEAQQDFGFETAEALSNHYLIKAREFSRDLSQAPCGWYTLPTNMSPLV
jgi:hypothetical protein